MTAIERIWYQKSKLAWLLLPLSGLFYCLSALRRLLFRLGIKPSHKVSAPVIIVGNISVGGTGKTPFTVWLIEQLKQQGFKPGIISRGYGSCASHYPYLVSSQDDAAVVGDEPKLLSERCEVPVVIAPKRVEAAEYLLANTDCNVIVSDDGLQHYAIKRDMEIVLVDGKRKLGNGFLLPAGPLREGSWRLDNVDCVIYNNDSSQACHMAIEAQTPIRVVKTELAKDYDPQAEYIAVSAIGNPERFYQTLNENNIKVSAKQAFIDHHKFSKQDFNSIDDKSIIMTEKDAVKCRAFANENFWFLPIQAVVSDTAQKQINTKLQSLKNEYGI